MKPGSREAIEAGCACPVMDNHYGAGIPYPDGPRFITRDGCPTHGYVATRDAAWKALAVLRDVEWSKELPSGQDGWCPVCDGLNAPEVDQEKLIYNPFGHKPRCALAEAIASLEGVL